LGAAFFRWGRGVASWGERERGPAGIEVNSREKRKESVENKEL
jgi:hypothetical protein